MGLGLYSLLEASILVLNAICILHEERFLAKCMFFFWVCQFTIIDGWGSDIYHFGTDISVKSRMLTFITSVRTVMRSKMAVYFDFSKLSSSYRREHSADGF